MSRVVFVSVSRFRVLTVFVIGLSLILAGGLQVRSAYRFLATPVQTNLPQGMDDKEGARVDHVESRSVAQNKRDLIPHVRARKIGKRAMSLPVFSGRGSYANRAFIPRPGYYQLLFRLNLF